MYRKYIKRSVDVVLASLLIVALSPLLLITYIIIKISELSSPAVFKQERCGKDKVPFILYKFRTMSVNAPKNVPTSELESANQHITKLGKFLRATSLDELPQLFNVFKGDMSFVGPRPVIFEETKLIAARDKYKANGVLPGLTGLAQINGRDEVGVDKKARMDGIYARNLSAKLDMSIFFMTVPAVISRKGVREGKIGDKKTVQDMEKEFKNEDDGVK